MEAGFAGPVVVLEVVFHPAGAWLAAEDACWLADGPAEEAADGLAVGAAVGCPVDALDPAGWLAGEVGQVGPPAVARGA